MTDTTDTHPVGSIPATRATVVDSAADAPATNEQVAVVADLHVRLRARDGVVHALRGVDLEIAPGEIVALVGESGSGKSVLGSTLLGLLPERSKPQVTGTVRIAGHDMIGGNDKTLRQVRKHLLGAVFQDPLTSLNPTMRIGRQLMERTDDRTRSIAKMSDAGVPDPERRFDQFPHELSGGLRQRVMIAMALGGDGRMSEADATAAAQALSVSVLDGADGSPRLVIADEPTTALDVSVQAQIILMFDRIRREHGCAILLVTHDLGVAASIADRIVVMYAGRLCEVGPAASVLDTPAHPYTAGLLNARLSLDGERTVRDPLPGDPPNPIHPLPGCGFAPRCARADERCSSELPEMTAVAAPTGRAAIRTTAHTASCFHPLNPGEPVGALRVGDDETATSFVIGPSDEQIERDALIGSGAPALILDGVTKFFPTKGAGRFRLPHLQLRAVNELSLTVPARGSVALVGESGCGKTTTLRMATGLLSPDHGTVTWIEGAARPQLVFQDASSSLTPWLTIESQVAERFGKLRPSEARERARGVLASVGLDQRAARSRPRELSGGQRQRAVIARCLASGPSLLVCDEPVSALDASLAARVLGLLEELRDDMGVALLVVTHDLAAARRIADEVSVMYLGRIVEHAPSTTLFTRPLHPYTQGLLAASPTTEPGRLAPTLSGEPPSAIGEITGCAFAARCPIAVDRCRVEHPLLRQIDDDTRVACHLV